MEVVKIFLKHLLYDTIHLQTLEKKQIKYVLSYKFPGYIIDRFLLDNPSIKEESVDEVVKNLKIYFLLFTSSRVKFCSMPSKSVDALWHTFLLYTREYHDFCNKAFSRFLHHRPDNSVENPNIKEELSNTYYGLIRLRKKFSFLDFDPNSIFKLDKKLAS